LPDVGLLLLDDPLELVDVGVGFGELLVGNVRLAMYGGDEAIGHGTCCVVKVFPLLRDAEYCFSHAG